MKYIKWVVLIVVLLVVAAAVIIYLNLSHIIRSTVQTQGTQSLQLATTLGGASLSLTGGSLGLNDLQIGSPKGFSAPHMLTLDDAAVRVNYRQLTQTPIHIAHIRLEKPVLAIEQSGGKLNINAAMDQIPKSEAEPMKMVIDQLEVADAQVIVHPGIPGIAQQLTLTLPPITLNNIGTAEGAQNGAAMKDVVMQVVTAMAAKASDSPQLPPEVRALLNLNVNQLAQQLSGQFQQQIGSIAEGFKKDFPGQLQKITQNPNELLKESQESLEQGLGGLIPPKKAPATQPK